MRSSATSAFASGRFCWVLLATGIQAIPNPVNRVIPSPNQSRGSRNKIRTIYPSTETGSLDQNQDFQGNTSSLASESILYHEQTNFLTPPVIITLVLFLTVAASIIAVFFYGHEMRSFFLGKLRRQKAEEPALGFGFDGLTEAEIEAHRWREEKEAMKKPFWHIKLPTKPPRLVLRHSLSSPISLDDAKIPLGDSKVDETCVENEKWAGVVVHAPDRCKSLRRASDPSTIEVVDR